jgi:hypothetical protein
LISALPRPDTKIIFLPAPKKPMGEIKYYCSQEKNIIKMLTDEENISVTLNKARVSFHVHILIEITYIIRNNKYRSIPITARYTL